MFFKKEENSFKKKFFILILIIIIIIIIFNKSKINKIDSFVNFCLKKTNIDYDDDFFQLTEVKEQIKRKNIIYIETIAGGYGNIGNALIMLNN